MGRKWRLKKRFGIFVVVLLALLLLTFHTAGHGSVVLSTVLGWTAPLQKVTAQAVAAVADAAEQAATSYDDLLAENEALRQQVTDLTNQLSGYEECQQENTRLRGFLGLKTNHPDFTFVDGSVIARDGADLFYSFRVDKGMDDGVNIHDPVITEAGLVGYVSSVSARQSTVTTILSPAAGVAALDQKSRDSGVVTGDVTLAAEGLVRLSYLERENAVAQGDRIITSGIGDNNPRGLLIGEAVAVCAEETDVSLYAIVKPYADIQNVRDVLIITDFAAGGDDPS